jgi:hypothetical protein
VGNVLDEYAFALMMVSTGTKSWRKHAHVSLVRGKVLDSPWTNLVWRLGV